MPVRVGAHHTLHKDLCETRRGRETASIYFFCCTAPGAAFDILLAGLSAQCLHERVRFDFVRIPTVGGELRTGVVLCNAR